MRKNTICILAALLACVSMHAKVTLPEIIGEYMVLQQNTKVKLWGKAEPGAKVSIEASWGEKVSTKAGKDGKWIVALQTPAASYEERSIVFSDGTPLIVNNILIGEVWYAGGQSNMEMPLNGFWHCPVEGANEDIATARKWKGVRMVTIPKNGCLTVQDEVPGKWKESTPENVRWFSATAWYFARMINESLDVPVGIITCSWGGTRVEGWLPEEIVRTYPDIDYDTECQKKEQTWWHYSNVTMMYNGMYHPIKDYTVKGFVWYQGESNVGKHEDYPERFNELVNIWRKNQGFEAPVYWVELAPWLYGGDGTSGARFREMQQKMRAKIPNSGIVCTNDLVYPDEAKQIHPRNKREVGNRLAYLALNHTYGCTAIEGYYPEYKSMTINGDTAELSFYNAEDGFTPWEGMQGFEIAGEDKVFHKAEAWLNNGSRTIFVRSSEVPAPVAVRYCFKDFELGNVISNRMLPLMPFRTDAW
ncbi:MAG: sialate O-acetylesterase [Candidatus Cryptobacteroides sp.]